MTESKKKTYDTVVIDDVMKNLRDNFHQSGLDESVIELLRDMWLLKLKKNEDESSSSGLGSGSGSDSGGENVIVIAESGDSKIKPKTHSSVKKLKYDEVFKF